jgi:DNA-binding GntR family transcriptional regulator
VSVEQQQNHQPGDGQRARGAGGAPAQQDGTLLARIRELVLGDGYAPGAALSEVRLAEHFNVSRTPVREALKQLQVEGLVEIRPKVGTFVRQITRREIVEMFEVKEVLEGMAARLLARRGQVPELDLLRANLENSEAATRAEHYTGLMNQLSYHRMVVRSVQHPGRLGRSCAEHRRIVELIAQKDGVGAEVAMREHVASSARNVMADSAVERD